MALLSDDVLLQRRDIAFKMRGKETTYRMFDEKHYSPKTGKYTESFSDVTVEETLLGFVDQKMIDDSGGKYQKGDRAFRFKAEDLPETPPNMKSRVQYGDIQYRIIDHVESSDGNVFVIVGRKI
jgi:hypothetical protein